MASLAGHTDTPEGRALAAVAEIERRVGGHGYTYADVHEFFASAWPALAELRWRAITAGIPHFTTADRERVMSTLAYRARTWGQEIRRADITKPDAVAETPADPFAGLPS